MADELVAAVEACLFAAGGPVTVIALTEALDAPADDVREALKALQAAREGGGVQLERVGSGYQLRTAVRYGPVIQRLMGARPQKLSRAALEVLAIVAYRQPVTRGEIESMRGVDSGGVLKTLLDRSLLRTAGRADEPGRPLLYRTTAAFLELFSLQDLRLLPTVAERASLARGWAGAGADDGDEGQPGGADAHGGGEE